MAGYGGRLLNECIDVLCLSLAAISALCKVEAIQPGYLASITYTMAKAV